MKLGWRLFMHSVRQLFLNIGPALQIAWLPTLIVFAVIYWAVTTMPPGFPMNGSSIHWDQVPEGTAPRILLPLVAYLFAFVWVAVGWHRYVLLQENPEWYGFPPRISNMGAYALVSVGIGILLALLVILIGIGLSIIAPIIAGSDLIANILGFIIQVLVYALFMRMAVALPAKAIGENFTIGDGLAATVHVRPAIRVLAALLLLFSWTPTFLAGTFLAPIVQSLMYQLAAQWIITMLGISVLTTLYGHFEQRRELLA